MQVVGVEVSVAVVVRNEIYFDSLRSVACANDEGACDEEKSREQELCELDGEMRMDSAPEVEVEVH